MSAKKKSKDLKYQDALEELESIVNDVENDAMDIDDLSAHIQRALELIHVCRTKLKSTELNIQQAFDQDQSHADE